MSEPLRFDTINRELEKLSKINLLGFFWYFCGYNHIKDDKIHEVLEDYKKQFDFEFEEEKQ